MSPVMGLTEGNRVHNHLKERVLLLPQVENGCEDAQSLFNSKSAYGSGIWALLGILSSPRMQGAHFIQTLNWGAMLLTVLTMKLPETGLQQKMFAYPALLMATDHH
jgi:hypothetical protein